MAMDGVAPRAKLNQQRARRFQAAKEHDDRNKVQNEMREQWGFTPLENMSEEEFARLKDSNVITPGLPSCCAWSGGRRGWYNVNHCQKCAAKSCD